MEKTISSLQIVRPSSEEIEVVLPTFSRLGRFLEKGSALLQDPTAIKCGARIWSPLWLTLAPVVCPCAPAGPITSSWDEDHPLLGSLWFCRKPEMVSKDMEGLDR